MVDIAGQLIMEGSGNFTECNDSLSRQQEDTILVIRISIGSAGLFTCLLAIVLVFGLKLQKHFIIRLATYKVVSILMINILDVFFAGYILSNHTVFNKVVCIATGFLLFYFFWINILLTVVIIFHFFSLAVCLKNFKRLEKYYILVSITLPILIVWIPFVNDNYGSSGALCWIRDINSDCTENKEGKMEAYSLWYGPTYVILLITIVAAILIVSVLVYRGYCQKVQGGTNDSGQPLLGGRPTSNHKKALMEVFPLLVYPAIFFFVNVIAIVHRIVNAVSQKIDYEMELTHSIVLILWGILSSAALLIFILMIQCRDKIKILGRKPLRKTTPAVVTHTINSREVNETIFTQGGMTTNTNTIYIIPQESEVDAMFENDQDLDEK